MKIILEGSYALTEKQAESTLLSLGWGIKSLRDIGYKKEALAAEQAKAKIHNALYKWL